MIHFITDFLHRCKAGITKKIFSFLLLVLPFSAFAHSGGVWIANDGCGNWYAIVFHYHQNGSAGSLEAGAMAGMYIDFDQNGVFDVNGTQYAYNNAGGFTASNGDFTRFTDWIDLTDKSVPASTYANDVSIQNEVLAWLNANKNMGKTYSLSVAISSGSSSMWYEALVCPIRPLSPGIYKASTSTSSAVESPIGYTNPFDLNYTPTNFSGALTTTSTCGESLKLEATLTQTCVEEYGLVYSTTNTLPAIGETGVSQEVLWTGTAVDLTNAALSHSIAVASADEYKTHYIRTYYKQNVAGTPFYVYSPLISTMPLDPAADCDGDGISNGTELATAPADKDTDQDGTPDYRDLDSDNDAIDDNTEGDTADCDGDTVEDFQDLTLNPDFQSQPADKTICSGTATSFAVSVTGGGLSFQWQVDDGAGFADITDNASYTGATTSELSVASATAILNGNRYRCIVNSSTCQTQSISDAATLTVQVTSPPAVANSTYVLNGTAKDLSANATGTDLAYYTQESGGASTSTPPTPSTEAAGVQEFWVTQTIAGCESDRANITITINPPNEMSGAATVKPAWFTAETVIDDAISITGSGTITNPKVYITSGFQSGDVLTYPGTLPAGITQAFDVSTGSLNFTGSGDSETWQTIFRAVTFKSTSANTSDREINYLISDAVALTVNGKPHYYQYISGSVSWSNAKISAATKRLFGLPGYLATIGSQEENDFIMNKLQSDGWVGGSDDYTFINAALGTNTFANQGAAEGKWYWVTGPEKGTPISVNNGSPQSVSGAYINWNGIAPSGEPNNTGGEHYMQLFSSNQGKWNDLPASSSLQGYVVEFGGYDSDPELSIRHARTIQYDAQPTISLTTSVATDVNKPYEVTFTFSEAVTGFNEEDIAITNATLSSFTAISSSEYTAIVTPLADGEVKLSIPADACNDNISTGNAASPVLSHLYDATNPTVALSTTAPDPVNAPFTVTVTFNEAVSGFVNDDISVTNGIKTDFTALDAATYTVKITPATDGPVVIEVIADVAQDNAANRNTAATKLTREYDVTHPRVTLTSTAPNHTNEAVPVTITFTEAVTGFDVNDLIVTNGTASSFIQVSSTEYTVVIIPDADGMVNVSLPAGVADDAAANTTTQSQTLARTYDATAPQGYEVAFLAPRVDVSNVSNITLDVHGAESGTTFQYEISAADGSVIHGTGQVVDGSFNLADIDVTSLPDGELTLSFVLKDEAGNSGEVTSVQITKVTRDIIAVTAPARLSVPIRTTYGQLDLPASVEVTYSTSEKEFIAVTWTKATYDGLVAGEYILPGELILASATTNLNGHAATLRVTVEENIAPTRVSISNAAFSPSIADDEVLAAFTTQDEDDTEFSYALVHGAGSADNGLFLIVGDKLYLKDNHGLSGRTQFSIRVQSTDPYGNTVESVFDLEKTDYNTVDILIPTTFSPNGDGKNDTWVPSELRFYNDVVVEIFDRSGVRLYHSTDPELGWDGRANGGSILEGPFFYIIRIRDLNVTKKGVLINLR